MSEKSEKIEDILTKLSIELPNPAAPVASYSPFTLSNNPSSLRKQYFTSASLNIKL